MAYQDFDVLCSFCDNPFKSQEALMDHLMMCGNKTDQCPNCRKYIRRAIFVYHYENDCANPDAPATDDDIKQTTKPSERPRVTMKCENCNQNFDKADTKAHQENCLRNPANRSKNQRSLNEENDKRKSDRSPQMDNNDDNARIPCEWCKEGIPLDRYENHAIGCREREHRRLEEELRLRDQQPRPAARAISPPTTYPVLSNSTYTVPSNSTRAVTSHTTHTGSSSSTPTVASSAPCKHCGKQTSLQGLSYHELCCKMNAKRNANH